MSEFLLSGRLTAESEFNNLPSGVNGACGVEAIASALRALHQSDVFTVAKCFDDIHSWGLCADNGVMTTEQIRQACEKYGLEIQNPNGENLEGFMTHFFSPTPRAACILFYENGQALVDTITHDGMDANNLHGHFNTALGYNTGGYSNRARSNLPQGFWVADGDNNIQNPIINGTRVHRGLNTDLVFYTVGDLALAQLSDVIAVSLPQPTTKTISVTIDMDIVVKDFVSIIHNDVNWFISWNQHLSLTADATLTSGTKVNIPFR